MDDGAITDLFQTLYDDIELDGEYPARRPYLAHYTSMNVLENVLATNEIWFSNPLFMNDLDEVTFGFIHAATEVKSNEAIRTALGTADRYKKFTDALDYYIIDFEDKHLLDTYVFCLSEHDVRNGDGMLSMWRGYGGEGKGAALVFDMSKLDPVEGGPIVLGPVKYGSEEERLAWFEKMASKVAKILTQNYIDDEKIYLASHAIFQRIRLFALFSKHKGFEEEREWRFIYMSDMDGNNKIRSMLHYHNGPRGVEPKLKFRLEPMDGVTPPDFGLDKVLANILLGPSTSSALALPSVKRMLDLIGRPRLKDRLVASSIPLRPT